MSGEPLHWSSRVERTTRAGRHYLVYDRRPRSVGALLRESRRWSDRTFIVHDSVRMTFKEHEAAVIGAGELMAGQGVREGDRVGILAANRPEWSVAFFAAMELGAIAVPLNSWWSEAEVEHACRTVEPRLVIADAERSERLAAGTRTLLVDELESVMDAGAAGPGDSVGRRLPEDEDRTGVILFTSGTTGFPKGAILSHRSLIANLHNLLVISRRLPHQLADDGRPGITLTNLPLFHIGAIQLLLMPLVVGAELVFPGGRVDPAEILRLVEQERVNTW
jgi:long-chain acyl-CoA synthetase